MKFLRIAIATAALAALGAPAAAQYVSSSDEFVTAVRDRDGSKATELIQANPRLIDMRDEKGDTALIVAVSRSDEDYTAFLLSHGADPNVAAKSGDTPLMAAVRDGFEQGVEWLLSKGAKVDVTPRRRRALGDGQRLDDVVLLGCRTNHGWLPTEARPLGTPPLRDARQSLRLGSLRLCVELVRR